MALGDLWSRTLVYFGIAEEEDDWEDEDGYAAEESLEESYRERPNVRRLTPRRSKQDFDDWTESESDAEQPTSRVEPVRPPRPERQRERRPQIEAVPSPSSVKVHLVLPRSFNDAQQIADRYKQRVADKVFLLTPRNVEVSAEQRAALLERGGFFNQA